MHNVVSTIAGTVVRAMRAIPETREKQIERRIAVIVTRSGGRFTDEVEREILEQALDAYPPLGCRRSHNS